MLPVTLKETYDRINIKIGKWRIFSAFMIGIAYSAVYPINHKWLFYWLLLLLYSSLWLIFLGRHRGDRPDFKIYFFAVGDVAFFISALSLEHNLLTNYSALLIIPLFQYLFRYGRRAALFYVLASTAGVLYICLFHYQSHPLHHLVIIPVMLMITLNEGLLIEENNNLRKQLYDLVIYDEMSGLYNYRYFCGALERELSLALRLNHGLALIILDIDNFKKINDTYGHEAGNGVIRDIAKILKDTVRDYDYVCRYGGEEFAVILPQTGIFDGLPVARRICEAIGGHQFDIGRVTVSIGIAAHPQNASQKENLIEKADKALYQSKRNGKNRVTASGEVFKKVL